MAVQMIGRQYSVLLQDSTEQQEITIYIAKTCHTGS